MPGKLLYLNEYNYSMAKKQQRKITVKNPKIGNHYYFNLVFIFIFVFIYNNGNRV